MLKEIRCTFFSHEKIVFHKGLNIILGDDDAKNSIGKSTALMVIDFAFGGDRFLQDDAGAIKALGHHIYNFSFEFEKTLFFFSRSTDTPELVYVCDQQYIRQEELDLDSYRKKLKELYKLNNIVSSFRSIVSPFSRIWKKGGLEPDQPFISFAKEPAGTAINRLIDLFGHITEIASEKKTLDDQRKRKKLINDSMNEKIIPNINKTKYKENARIINESNVQINQLKQGFSGAISTYEGLFDEDLRILQQRKNELRSTKTELQSKLVRLSREISGITPRLSENIALVSEFFPTVNVERLEKVEIFHHKIGNIVKKELKNELAEAEKDEKAISDEIAALDTQIQNALSDKGMPDDLFNKVFSLKEETDRATEENKYFDQKENLGEAIKSSNKRMEDIYSSILTSIQMKTNLKLKRFNKVVYGPTRNSSELIIKNANSYSFTSPDDSGTGKSYAGLVGFDLAMIALTPLPFFIHDSIVYKNIEIPAVKKILRILSFIKPKQTFLSFDEAKKYGSQAEKIIEKSSVLKLSHNDLLYNMDWRDEI